MSNLFRSKGFKSRLLGALFLSAIVVPSYLIAEGEYLRYVLIAGFFLAFIELMSITINTRFFPSFSDIMIITSWIIFLSLSYLGAAKVPVQTLGGIIIVCVATDVGAYLTGKLFGGRFSTTHPFTSSPNKTWEGLWGGILIGALAAVLWEKYAESSLLLVTVPCAVLGDLLESRLKRRFGVKDSNDFVIEVPLLRVLEAPLGGADGHGGYFDRLDSLIFALSVQFLLRLI